MDSFSALVFKILEFTKPEEIELSIEQKRKILTLLNDFLYTGNDKLGTVKTLERELPYFSEYHKFWKENYREILKPTIDPKQCSLAAEALHRIFVKYGRKPFYELYETRGLKPEEICRVRYFSANQDFRDSQKFPSLAGKYKANPDIFNTQHIERDPADFLKAIGITKLAQNDKREKYAQVSARMLIDNGIEPYDIFAKYGNDLQKIREWFVNNPGSGFGKKKTDMFLRDMVVLDVWHHPRNFDKIDVASDVNTIKVALRSGILKTDIPLLTSFLDIFSYQYELMDEMNASAWRRVWEIWRSNYPSECVESPCLMDYLIYRIVGREFCKESLLFFECKTKTHTFKWHSSRNRKCQICAKQGNDNMANVIKKVLPCTDKDGYIVITKSKFVTGKEPILGGAKECPFVEVCRPQSAEFIKFNPPKSISILGRTGWDSARTEQGDGGGGLMS